MKNGIFNGIYHTFVADMTRKCFAILLLVVYAVVLLKPLLPFVEYTMNKEYIAKNLCENRNKPKMHCNGKCHLMKQLKKQGAALETSGNNNQKNVQEQEENAVHVGGAFAFALANIPVQSTEFYIQVNDFLPSAGPGSVFHPPCKA